MRTLQAELLSGSELYREVILKRLFQARESVWISTANVKEMYVEQDGSYRSILELFARLCGRGVELRLLHAELPSRPFRKEFDRHRSLVEGGVLKHCPRVHMKAVIVDGAWLYVGSANLTGAGLGIRGDDKRNFELGFVTEDFRLLDEVQSTFDRVWRGDPCSTCKLRDVCPDPIGAPPAAAARRARRRR
jgi:phosphatidylserine/phosphatidylglycerophosphate/cardiolipin synthase-like enzyme